MNEPLRLQSEFSTINETMRGQVIDIGRTSLPDLTAEWVASSLDFLSFAAETCSPPTPVDQLNGYTSSIAAQDNQMRSVLNSTPPGSLHMRSFAGASNNFVRYVNSLPSSFCIEPTNQEAFNSLNRALTAAVSTLNGGKSLFEANVDGFSGRATPPLNALLGEASRIDSSSRDFTSVIAAYQRWDAFYSPYQGKIEVWHLTPRIQVVWEQLIALFNRTDAELIRAIAQIEANVETEVKVFESQRSLSDAAITYWDEVDGKEGYDRYVRILKEIGQKLIPAFNAFLHRVPHTSRVRQAVAKAQESINAIEGGFKAFPNLDPLPAADANFPHKRYGSGDRKYSGGLLRNALITIAQEYIGRTGKPIHIGDLNYQHGGKIKNSKHKSHKLGIDGDVDGTEIGDYPQNDKPAALALAKEILQTGPEMVFYADPAVVSDGNKWAENNQIRGRLVVEASHDRHFHLRMSA